MSRLFTSLLHRIALAGNRHGWNAPIVAVRLMIAIAALANPLTVCRGQIIQQIDPHGIVREIPDLETGGFVELTDEDNQVIDVVILGDGYLAGQDEIDKFFDDAQAFYDGYLSDDPNDPGQRPFLYFSQAFRVRAVFTASVARVSVDRGSFYRLKVDADDSSDSDLCPQQISAGGWWNDADADAQTFRNRLFGIVDAINAIDPPVNFAQYPAGTPTVPGENAPAQAGVYSNLFVVMLTCADNGSGACCRPNGRTMLVEEPPDEGTRKIRVTAGAAHTHEFGHAFGYLGDEYIDGRGCSSDTTNPVVPSVFSLSNRSYSNARCDLLWPHLAPSGRYNPNLFSPIGNLYRGGTPEHGVWHSEYNCQMNGRHENYTCNADPVAACSDPDVAGVDLRDRSRFCFWCEEVLTVRILEKTGQFARPGDPDPENDIEALGETWFELWDSSLRDRYYERFNIPMLIAQKNACYGFGPCAPPPFDDCTGACDTAALPACLLDCDIRELGNAVYVDSDDGFPVGPGTRAVPLANISSAVTLSQGLCTSPNLIALLAGSYPGPLTISDPAILIPAGCSAVIVGQ